MRPTTALTLITVLAAAELTSCHKRPEREKNIRIPIEPYNPMVNPHSNMATTGGLAIGIESGRVATGLEHHRLLRPMLEIGATLNNPPTGFELYQGPLPPNVGVQLQSTLGGLHMTYSSINGSLVAVAAREFWNGTTDKGIKIGDPLAKLLNEYKSMEQRPADPTFNTTGTFYVSENFVAREVNGEVVTLGVGIKSYRGNNNPVIPPGPDVTWWK